MHTQPKILREVTVSESRKVAKRRDSRRKPLPRLAFAPPALLIADAALPSCTRIAPAAARPTTRLMMPITVAALRTFTCCLLKKASFFVACIEMDETRTARNCDAMRASETKSAVGVRGNWAGRALAMEEGRPTSEYISKKMGVKEGDMQLLVCVVELV